MSVETCRYMLHAVSVQFLFKRAHGFCRSLSPSTSKKSRAKLDSNGSTACSFTEGSWSALGTACWMLSTKHLWLMLEFFVVSKSSSPSPDSPQKQVQACTLQSTPFEPSPHSTFHLILGNAWNAVFQCLPSFCPCHLCLFHLPAEEAPSPDQEVAMPSYVMQFHGANGKAQDSQDARTRTYKMNRSMPHPVDNRHQGCCHAKCHRFWLQANHQSQESSRKWTSWCRSLNAHRYSTSIYSPLFSNTQLFIQEAVRGHCSPNIWRAVPRSVWQSSLFSLLWNLILKEPPDSKHTCKNPGSIAKQC